MTDGAFLMTLEKVNPCPLKIHPGEGSYTDMNAVRPDEVLDNLHSFYVDQRDWERMI